MALQHTRVLSLTTLDGQDIPIAPIWHETDIADFALHCIVLQHGACLPSLQVRVQLDTERAEDDVAWLLRGSETEHPVVLGLDTETAQHLTRPSLLQLATSTRCLLIPLRHTGAPCAPAIVHLLADRGVVKGGAELWPDVLDLWALHRTVVNGCVNATSHFRALCPGSRSSLAAMCNTMLGDGESLVKDACTNCSDWSRAPRLTLRQIVYAALDAQASCVLTTALLLPGEHEEGERGRTIGAHLGDLPAKWLDRAARWNELVLLERREQRQELNVAFEQVVFGRDGVVVVHMKQYTTRVRLGSRVQLCWVDGSREEVFVRSVQGKRALLERAISATNSVALDRICLHRAHERDLVRHAHAAYLDEFVQRTRPPSPFEVALLDLPKPSDFLAWLRSAKARYATLTRSPSDDAYRQLDASQRSALDMARAHRISAIQGPPGAGKTRTIAAEVARVVSQNERVLCLAETNTAARHMCEAIARVLPPSRVQLWVSGEFEHEWHAALYDDLVGAGYMSALRRTRARRGAATAEGDEAGREDEPDDPDVLICTIGKLIASVSSAVLHRSTLVMDESSQVHDLRALLVLRALPDTERLLLFGDHKQLAPYVARQEVSSVLDLANAAAINPSGSAAGRAMLEVQYRMPPTLGATISDVFYGGRLRHHQTRQQELPGCLVWVDVPQGRSQVESATSRSVYNDAELDAVHRWWQRLQRAPYRYTAHDIVVVSPYEAQRKRVVAQHPAMRVYNVDSFQGQEAPVILLTLAATRATAFLRDPRRVNVACSRAQQRLVIFGKASGLIESKGCWASIHARCRSETAAPTPTAALASAPVSAYAHVLYEMVRARKAPVTVAQLGALFATRNEEKFKQLTGGEKLDKFLRRHATMFDVYLHPRTDALFVRCLLIKTTYVSAR